MSNLVYESLHENLTKLKLNTVGTILDNYLEIAAKEGQTTLEVLDYLIAQEKHAKDASKGKKNETCRISLKFNTVKIITAKYILHEHYVICWYKKGVNYVKNFTCSN